MGLENMFKGAHGVRAMVEGCVSPLPMGDLLCTPWISTLRVSMLIKFSQCHMQVVFLPPFLGEICPFLFSPGMVPEPGADMQS